MANHSYEIALGRAVDYLTRCGIDMTPDVLEGILRVIRLASRYGEKGLLQRVMDDLPNHFDIRLPRVHRSAPPITRKSIGYG